MRKAKGGRRKEEIFEEGAELDGRGKRGQLGFLGRRQIRRSRAAEPQRTVFIAVARERREEKSPRAYGERTDQALAESIAALDTRMKMLEVGAGAMCTTRGEKVR